MSILFIDAIPSKVKIHSQDDIEKKVTTEVLFFQTKICQCPALLVLMTNYGFLWIFSNTNLIIHWSTIFF